jgi:CBS domain-containing protein
MRINSQATSLLQLRVLPSKKFDFASLTSYFGPQWCAEHVELTALSNEGLLMAGVKIAEDFMRRKLVTLTPETSVCDGVAKLLKDNISGAPVVDSEGNYLGVFSEKCCMNALTEPVEAAVDLPIHMPQVREFMTTELVTLRPDVDVFDAIDDILARRISGAPVVDSSGRYLGIFSEKTAMRALIAAVHDQVPGTRLDAYMNVDRNRLIQDDDRLVDIAHKFQETPFRRLPVLYGEKLGGQVSRRDVLRAEHRLVKEVESRAQRSDADERLRSVARANEVGKYMDTEALTTSPEKDLLTIAQMFLNSPYRRLPILMAGKLVGQVSRRDLLEAAAETLRPTPTRHRAETLYLSPLAETAPPSLQ